MAFRKIHFTANAPRTPRKKFYLAETYFFSGLFAILGWTKATS
jgi:hypothetical protein